MIANLHEQLTSDLVAPLQGSHWIDNELVGSDSDSRIDVIDPSTTDVIGSIPNGDRSDVDRAVESSSRAFYEWSGKSNQERGNILAHCARLISEHETELAQLIALESGKALRTESRPEAVLTASIFDYFSGLALEIKGENVPLDPSMLAITRREPLGVVAAITPWNVPLGLMALKVAPALVTGNTAVVKPSELAPFSSLRLAQIIGEAVPPGVLNVVAGDGPKAGESLSNHVKTSKVSFTGSVETGRKVYLAAAKRITPVTLELGGKSPMLVMGDADLDKAVTGALDSMRFTRAGQSCTASGRIFVHESLFDEFLSSLKEKLAGLTFGDPLDERTDVGPLISQKQMERVQHYVSLAESSPGTEIVRIGKLPESQPFSRGFYYKSTLMVGLTNDHPSNQDEIFGPVTAIMPWSDYDTLIEQANDTAFGLAASVWTNDMTIAMRTTHRLQAGYVHVNQSLVLKPGLSYGGYKNSGMGREASCESMLDHYTQKKTITFNFD